MVHFRLLALLPRKGSSTRPTPYPFSLQTSKLQGQHWAPSALCMPTAFLARCLECISL